jgi:16S rRNA (cytosine1402-N4)-methyltransferase
VRNRPVNDTADLAAIVISTLGEQHGKIHPATRTFQALRIAVNRELDHLTSALEQSLRCLAPGGRLAVISYHSLEDRIVKNFMLRETKTCICPDNLPECRCHHTPQFILINKHPIIPTDSEIDNNPRSRSAKLRIAQKL